MELKDDQVQCLPNGQEVSPQEHLSDSPPLADLPNGEHPVNGVSENENGLDCVVDKNDENLERKSVIQYSREDLLRLRLLDFPVPEIQVKNVIKSKTDGRNNIRNGSSNFNHNNNVHHHQHQRTPKKNLVVIELSKQPVKLSTDENAWKPSVRQAAESARSKNGTSNGNNSDTTASPEKQTEMIVKQARGILNKLTKQNFDKMCDNFANLDINENEDRISAVIKVVFEKAVDEPSFSSAYANMIKVFCQRTSANTVKIFQKQILGRCQKEFQNISKDEGEYSRREKEIQETSGDNSAKDILRVELEEFRFIMRRKSLGNVRFIGELFKLQMLSPKIMVDCVQMLLRNDDEESYESLCKLLTTVGQMLDNALRDYEFRVLEAKRRAQPLPRFIPPEKYMENTFKKLEELSESKKLCSRIRFALLDLVELRGNNWKSRRNLSLPLTKANSKPNGELEFPSPAVTPSQEEALFHVEVPESPVTLFSPAPSSLSSPTQELPSPFQHSNDFAVAIPAATPEQSQKEEDESPEDSDWEVVPSNSAKSKKDAKNKELTRNGHHPRDSNNLMAAARPTPPRTIASKERHRNGSGSGGAVVGGSKRYENGRPPPQNPSRGNNSNPRNHSNKPLPRLVQPSK